MRTKYATRTAEARLPEIAIVAPDRARAADAGRVQRHVAPHVLGHVALGQQVADGNAAAGSEQPEHLVEHLLLVVFRHQTHDAVADDAVCDHGP